MKRLGPWTHYGWGWDIGPIFGWWFVWSHCDDGRLSVYVSSDATPPDNPETTRGAFLWQGRRSPRQRSRP